MDAMERAGLDAVEAERHVRVRPEGLLECLMHDMGYTREWLHPSGRAELQRIDLLDDELGRFLDARDLADLWRWLGSASEVHSFRGPLNMAGAPPWPTDDAEPSIQNLEARLSIVTAHQVLSFLAILDHEATPVIAAADWRGHSLVATLIAPPHEPGCRRQIASPVALLIDLIVAASMADPAGRLPERRPAPLAVAKWMRGRGRGGGDLDQRIHRLRREQTKLDGKMFKAFVREMRHTPAGPNQTLEDEARMVFPLLVAAHLLSMMMPRRTGSPHHDRRGWREAYLHWWTHHAEARGLPTEPAAAAGPPDWISFA